MKTVFAATVLPFLRQTKCKSTALSPAYLLALIASLIQTSSILFAPSSPSSGDNSLTLAIKAVPSTRVPPTPTTKNPTRTTPYSIVERSDTLGFYLTVGTLFIGLLLSLATVCSRARPKSTYKNRPPPRRNPRRGQRSAPPPPPTDDPTNSGDTDDGAGNGDSDSDNSGNGGSGSGERDGDNSNNTIDKQETDDSQSEKLLRAEPDPEDPPPPPPPPPTTLNENDDDPKVTLHGPILSLLHFLLGAVAGLLTRLVAMDATKYRQDIQRPLRNIISRLISMKIGSSGHILSDSSSMKMPYSCQHRSFVIATAEVHSLLPPRRRVKVGLPAPFTRIFFRYIPYAISRVSRTYIYVIENIRPLINWFIHAMANDLVIIEACIPIAIDRIRAVDAEYGSSIRLIVGCTVLVLVVFEVYRAELPASLADTTSRNVDYEDDILFPFADVDLPLNDTEFLRPHDACVDTTDRLEDNIDIFSSHDVGLPLVEAELDNVGMVQTSAADPIHSNNGTVTVDGIESPVSAEQPGQAVEEVLTDWMLAASSDYTDVEHAEIPETSHDIHKANNCVFGQVLPSTSNEDPHSVTVAHALTLENVQSEEIPARASSGEVSRIEDRTSIEEDPDTVLECLYELFNSSSIVQSILKEECASTHVLVTEGQKIADTPLSREESHIEDETTVEDEATVEDETIAEEDLDIILECLVDLPDSSIDRSFSEEESFPKVLTSVSPRRAPGGSCVRAFTSCEAFAAMFGFEHEEPLEFLQPFPARLERLLPPYSIFPNTPARYFTLGAPPATPTTPYARWIEERHQTTPFIPSPFGPPRTPPHPPPTISIPSPTSSEGTQPPGESPAAIRARRLDRKWAKMMAKRQRNEARYIVPRVQIEETSSSSSIASDTSIRSFFDPHASINQGIRDTEIEAGLSKLTKWKPRSPGDPAPRQKRRWRNKDVFVGTGKDEGYGVAGVAMN